VDPRAEAMFVDEVEQEFVAEEAAYGRELSAEVRRQVTRTLAFRRIFGAERLGWVDGIEINLSHPELPAADWYPFRLGWASDRYFSLAEEPLIFMPWYDPKSRRWARSRMSEEQRATVVSVRPRDAILIDCVEFRRVGDDLTHPADREQAFARLVLIRPNGSTAPISGEIRFVRKLSMTGRGAGLRVSFDVLAGRINELVGARDFHELPYPDDDEQGSDEGLEAPFGAYFEGGELVRKWRNASETLQPTDAADWPFDDAAKILEQLVEQAVSFGYWAAQAEADTFMRPHIFKAAKTLMAPRKAARESAAVRSNMATDRQIHAIELLCGFSPDRVPKIAAAHEFLAKHWSEHFGRPPSASTIAEWLTDFRADPGDMSSGHARWIGSE
jgi:hypothetical protein